MSGLSRKHESTPVLDSDRVMSKRHLARRAMLDKMKDGGKKKKLSAYYNLSHAREHLAAPTTGRAGKKIAKAVEKIQKKMGMTSLSSFLRK